MCAKIMVRKISFCRSIEKYFCKNTLEEVREEEEKLKSFGQCM